MSTLSKAPLAQAPDVASSAEAVQRGLDQQVSVLIGIVKSGATAIKGAVIKAWSNYLNHRGKRRAYEELMSLDQRMLSDIGISHQDVHAVVYGDVHEDSLRAADKTNWSATRPAHA